MLIILIIIKKTIKETNNKKINIKTYSILVVKMLNQFKAIFKLVIQKLHEEIFCTYKV